MEHQSKTKPGFSSSDHRNLEDMTSQELVSVLRTAFLTEDFDRVEDVLVRRDKRLQTQILHLQEMVETEKLTRFQAEEDSRKKEEVCEKGKRAESNYEKLLEEVKKNTSLADRETIGELRKKNNELELEVCELRKLKEKWVDDINALAQLSFTVGVLQNENNALSVKNSELEKSLKNNNEALAYPLITEFKDKDEENVRSYEPPSKRSKNELGALSSDNLPFRFSQGKLKEKRDVLKKQLKISITDKDKDKTLKDLASAGKSFNEYSDKRVKYIKHAKSFDYLSVLKQNVDELKHLMGSFQESMTAKDNALLKINECLTKSSEDLVENKASLCAINKMLLRMLKKL